MLLQTNRLNVTVDTLTEVEQTTGSLNSQNGLHGVEDSHFVITVNCLWLER